QELLGHLVPLARGARIVGALGLRQQASVALAAIRGSPLRAGSFSCGRRSTPPARDRQWATFVSLCETNATRWRRGRAGWSEPAWRVSGLAALAVDRADHREVIRPPDDLAVAPLGHLVRGRGHVHPLLERSQL